MKQYALPTWRGPVYYPTPALLHFRIPLDATIERISLYLTGMGGIAEGLQRPTFDINLNGVSIFADPDDRPRFDTDEEPVVVDGLSIAVARGDFIEIDVDEVGFGNDFVILDCMFDLEDGLEAGSGSAFVWHGAWAAETAYVPNDVVEHLGSSWIAIGATTGDAPGSAPTKWEIVAAKGAAGADGADGADGAPGAPGADGADGASFNPRGAWDAATNYVPLDVVSRNGSSYVAHAPSLNIVPPDASAWTLLSSKGDPGDQGPQGDPGEGGGASSAEPDFITGLELSIVGNTWDDVIQVSPGAAWVPGLNKVVRLAAPTNVTPGAFTTDVYYVYLGEAAGVATLEATTTPPVYYQGDAQNKTGNTSKRLIGMYYRDGTIGINGFHAHANGNRVAHIWRKAYYSAPLLLLNAAGGSGSDETLTPMTSSSTNLIPPCAAELHLMVRLACAANSRMFAGFSQFNADSGNGDAFGAEALVENDNPTGSTREITANVTLHLNRGTQAFHYWTQVISGSGASLSVYLRGITYRR